MWHVESYSVCIRSQRFIIWSNKGSTSALYLMFQWRSSFNSMIRLDSSQLSLARSKQSWPSRSVICLAMDVNYTISSYSSASAKISACTSLIYVAYSSVSLSIPWKSKTNKYVPLQSFFKMHNIQRAFLETLNAVFLTYFVTRNSWYIVTSINTTWSWEISINYNC